MKPFRSSTTAASATADRPHVLYVEDDDQNWEVAELRLTNRYHLHRARNDREAFAAIQKYGGSLAVILMDIQLADSALNGIEITRLLRGLPIQGPGPGFKVDRIETPILFVTAAGAEYSEAFLLQQGGSELITKPVEFTKLNLALARACLTKLNAIVGGR